VPTTSLGRQRSDSQFVDRPNNEKMKDEQRELRRKTGLPVEESWDPPARSASVPRRSRGSLHSPEDGRHNPSFEVTGTILQMGTEAAKRRQQLLEREQRKLAEMQALPEENDATTRKWQSPFILKKRANLLNLVL